MDIYSTKQHTKKQTDPSYDSKTLAKDKSCGAHISSINRKQMYISPTLFHSWTLVLHLAVLFLFISTCPKKRGNTSTCPKIRGNTTVHTNYFSFLE